MRCLTLILSISLCGLSFYSLGQKSKLENVPQICKNLPLEQRTIIAVSSFVNSATDTNRIRSAGLSDMLSNALFNTGCYAVLERKDLGQVIKEQDFSNSSRFDSKTAVKLGKLKGASILIMGNLTEFSENTGGGAIGGAIVNRITKTPLIGGVGIINAHLGMIIKIVDTKTGMIIESKSFERKVTRAGLLGGGVVGYNAVGGGTAWTSKAMQDAAEELIIDIVEFISKKSPVTKNNTSAKKTSAQSLEVVFKSIDYEELQQILTYLKNNKDIKDIQKTFDNKTATLEIDTPLSSDNLADYLYNFKDIKTEVISLTEDKIVMKVK